MAGTRSLDLIIVTGMSGAGKGTAAKTLEEFGYVVVDNLPPDLLGKLVETMDIGAGARKLCAVIDARSGKPLAGLASSVAQVRNVGVKVTVIFMDANDSVLVQRYSETRKRHPFGSDNRGVLAAVEYERAVMHQSKLLASIVIDTSETKTDELRNKILSSVAPDVGASPLLISLTSFGFKFGLPIDADLVFDVRFLNNPHYVDDLRPYDGRNKIIDDFVMKDPDSQPFIEKVRDLLNFALPRYIEEGKAYLTVGIGCTGGRHRSVVISERLGTELRELGYRVVNNHRDVAK